MVLWKMHKIAAAGKSHDLFDHNVVATIVEHTIWLQL